MFRLVDLPFPFHLFFVALDSWNGCEAKLSGVCFSATAVRKTAWRRRVAGGTGGVVGTGPGRSGRAVACAGSGSVADGFRRRPKRRSQR